MGEARRADVSCGQTSDAERTRRSNAAITVLQQLFQELRCVLHSGFSLLLEANVLKHVREELNRDGFVVYGKGQFSLNTSRHSEYRALRDSSGPDIVRPTPEVYNEIGTSA
jgi:hypothetical protein